MGLEVANIGAGGESGVDSAPLPWLGLGAGDTAAGCGDAQIGVGGREGGVGVIGVGVAWGVGVAVSVGGGGASVAGGSIGVGSGGGGGGGSTVTANVTGAATLPAVSCAEQVTNVVPTAKSDPDAGEHPTATAPSTSSRAPGTA